MKGLFCAHCKAKNNEEYKEVLKKRLIRVRLICLSGVLIILGAAVLFHTVLAEMGDYHQGVTYGMGTGLILGSIVAMLRIYRTLASEEKLKEQRLKETDEREVEISNMALRQTAKLLLAVLYLSMVFGALVSEELLYLCCLLIGIFLLSYIGFQKYYENKV
ncbi:MAG: hypothetical protein HDQ99_04835 [Lachnospiraceae bacterium]|nr:hypothetical protein [Lachnospiraceae bacterium]